MIPYKRKLVTIAINEELRKQFWQACEERKEFALSHSKFLQAIKDEQDGRWIARFNELWEETCQHVESYWRAEMPLFHKRRWSDEQLRRDLLLRVIDIPVSVISRLRHEREVARKYEAKGYEAGRKDGIVEVYDRDRENREKGQGFKETPQGMKKRAKAELLAATFEEYKKASETATPISMTEAVRIAAKKLGMKGINVRSRTNQAYKEYPEWLEERKRKRQSQT